MASLTNRHDWDRARTVAEDLTYLMDEWKPSLDEAQLRRDSPILRRLLIEDDYTRPWRSIGLSDEPYVSAPDFAAFLGATTRPYVQFATGPPGITVATSLGPGGQLQVGVLRSVTEGSLIAVAPGLLQGLGVILLVVPPEEVGDEARDTLIAAHLKPGAQRSRGRPLCKFLASTFALVLGTEVSRRDVIKYVAQKLGGAHFDPRRGRSGDTHLELLDRLSKTRLEITDKRPINAVYVELLSIAEWLAESGDAARFRDAFSKVPEPE
jgi:hypothetical protein